MNAKDIKLLATCMDFMTEDQWQEIQKYNLDSLYGFRIVRSGNRYMVEYLLESRKVGKSMFAGGYSCGGGTVPRSMRRRRIGR